MRKRYIDSVKALAIVLMIAGHIGFGSKVDHYIHGFHMPIFFVISGFLYKNYYQKGQTWFEFLKKKGYTLLIPFVIWGGIAVMSDNLIQGRFIFYNFACLVKIPTEIPISGALWFLPVMYFAVVFYSMIDAVTRGHSIIKIAIVIMVCVIGELVYPVCSYITTLSIAVGFLAIGQYSKHVVDKVERYSVCIGIFIISSIGIIVNSHVNVRLGISGNPILFWCSAAGWSISVICILRLLEKNTPKLGNNFWVNQFNTIGKNSVVYLCLNEMCIRTIQHYLYPIVGISYISNGIVLASTIFIIYFITFISTKFKLGILFGK